MFKLAKYFGAVGHSKPSPIDPIHEILISKLESHRRELSNYFDGSTIYFGPFHFCFFSYMYAAWRVGSGGQVLLTHYMGFKSIVLNSAWWFQVIRLNHQTKEFWHSVEPQRSQWSEAADTDWQVKHSRRVTGRQSRCSLNVWLRLTGSAH